MAKVVKFKKLEKNAQIPQYAYDTDAGADIRSSEEYVLMPNETAMINTGFSVAIPEGFFGAIASKSGLASRGIVVANSFGVVDSSYRGEVKVLLYNRTKAPFEINEGDKIAQFILMPFMKAQFREVEELDDTERKDGGFGSTDDKKRNGK